MVQTIWFSSQNFRFCHENGKYSLLKSDFSLPCGLQFGLKVSWGRAPRVSPTDPPMQNEYYARVGCQKTFYSFFRGCVVCFGSPFILVVSKWLLYLPNSCRPKEVKLFEDKDGNLATYIEDCVSSGKFLQIYLPAIALLYKWHKMLSKEISRSALSWMLSEKSPQSLRRSYTLTKCGL